MVTLINSYVICVKHEEKRLFLFSYQTYSPFFGGKDILDLGETSASLCLSNIAISKKSNIWHKSVNFWDKTDHLRAKRGPRRLLKGKNIFNVKILAIFFCFYKKPKLTM